MWSEFILNRYKVMQELLEEVVNFESVVVDLGAGKDPISAPLKCRRRYFLDIKRENSPSVICNFENSLPLRSSSVDVVVAGEILEHITQSRKLLEEIRRILRTNGWLVLSVPNIVSLKYRVAFLIGRIPRFAAKADYTYSDITPSHNFGHVRDYSFGELRHLLHEHGFHVVSERSIGMHWNGRRIIPPWVMPVTFSDNVIVKAILDK